MTAPRAPLATYRLQLNAAFGFDSARALVPYLRDLGISHLYLSPIMEARRGSAHGYDVVDPLRVAEELGGERGLRALANAARAHGLRIVVDTVPNHMAATAENPWWRSLLELGPSSPFADMFDIDWDAAGPAGAKRLLLPWLPDRYDAVLDRGELVLQSAGAGPVLRSGEAALPLDPGTWGALLRHTPFPAEQQAGWASLSADCAALGPACRAPRDRGRRLRARELRRRWRALRATPAAARAIDAGIAALNQDPDRLDALLTDQPYRLAHWRLAAEVASYRRFFDISALAAVRVDRRRVFRRVHRKLLQLLAEGVVQDLRVDHVDGLRDPGRYLRDLGRAARRAGAKPWIVVEKVLCQDETMPPAWDVAGTTGYDFVAAAARMLVDPDGVECAASFYASWAGGCADFATAAVAAKRAVAQGLFAGELGRLGRRLRRLALADRRARDLPPSELERALLELTANLPVYRTYLSGEGGASPPSDRAHVRRAVAAALARQPDLRLALAFLERLLLQPGGADAVRFVQDWQQLTGPVMAKGVEDCALYRDQRLVALNEVGSSPAAPRRAFGVAAFHQWNRCLAARGLNATTTHDTKRSEDARCRVQVLSEIPAEWQEIVQRFHECNEPFKTAVSGGAAPDRGEELLFYQTLLAAWPPDAVAPSADFVTRIEAYLTKALREARVHSDWHSPNVAYEQAVVDFARSTLDPRRNAAFLAMFLPFCERVAFCGAMSSLSLLAIKALSPGTPDFYQGSELWELSLVDPDNRRPVDFARRAALLAESRDPPSPGAPLCAELLETWRDGRVKLLTMHRALGLRREWSHVVQEGDYVPLATPGTDDVCAFARTVAGDWIACVAPVRFAAMSEADPQRQRRWQDASLQFPDAAPSTWRDVMTGALVQLDRGSAPIRDVLRLFPVAMLVAAHGSGARNGRATAATAADRIPARRGSQ